MNKVKTEVKKSLDGIEKDITEAVHKSFAKIDSLKNPLKEINELLKLDPHNTILLNQKLDILKENYKQTKSHLKELKQEQGDMKKVLKGDSEAYQEFQRSMIRARQEMKSLKTEIRETKDVDKRWEIVIKNIVGTAGNAIKGVSKTIGGIIGGMINAVGSAAKLVGSGIQSVGKASIEIGSKAVSSASEVDKAVNQFIASTGKGEQEAEEYQKVMEGIYSNNYGESFQEISEAISTVSKEMGQLSGDGLQTITESAFALRDVFQYDIADSTEAAKTLMDHFGLSGEDAMELIAAGAQKNSKFSEQLLDGIGKYSDLFTQLGFNADDMFKIFQAGADGGALSLDSIGEAVSEMSVRISDGSESTREGFEKIGLNADEMIGKFTSGGESAKEAFEQTIEALAGMEDPLEQNAAGADLFGSMWSELGPGVVEQLASISEGAYDTAGAMDQIKEIKYDDLGSMLEELNRKVEALAIPIGEALMPLLSDMIQEIIPVIEESLPPLIELIQQAIEQIVPVVEEILPILLQSISELLPSIISLVEELLPIILQLFTDLAPIITQIIKELLPPLVELFEMLLPPIAAIIGELLPPLVKLFESLMPLIDEALKLLAPLIDRFTDLIGPVVSLINDAIAPLIETFVELVSTAIEPLMPVIETLAGIFTDTLQGAIEGIKPIIEEIIKIFQGIIDFITGIFTGDWEKAWQGICDLFGGIISGIINIFKVPLNWIIDAVNGFINGINSIRIPDWVPIVGGLSFHIPNIPRLKAGIDFVPSDWFPAYLDRGERVLTQSENQIYTELGGVQGLEYAMSAFLAKGGNSSYYFGENLAQALKDAGFIPGSGHLKAVLQIDGRETAIILAPYISEEVGFH